MKFETIKEVEEWQFRSYDEKLDVTNKAIQKALSISNNPAVAFSGGKNSLVALHLTLQYKPDVIVVFNNTLVEYPETVKYVHKISEEWNLNFYEVKPDKGVNYWKIVKEHGFPQVRSWRKDKVAEPKCCSLLKTKPVAKFYNAKKVDCYITGISAFESRMRKLGIYKYGIIRTVKRVGHDGYLWKRIVACHPIALWTELDVWRYIEENELPVNPVYEKYGLDRTGCMFCTGYIGWEKVISRTHPNAFKKIIKMMEEQSVTNSNLEPKT